MDEQLDALVIGAGPAGLMAAEALAHAGRQVVICEAMASPARKFLMAGKSGLNLTFDAPLPEFLAAYEAPWLMPILSAFGPAEVKAWAEALGIALFTGSSGRVFPRGMKASPLLRAWLHRLDAAGVQLRRRWRWPGPDAGGGFLFETPEGPRRLLPGVAVLALGGASWARLGSTGTWAPGFAAAGVTMAPFQPANVGLSFAWSPAMARHFGAPVKNVALAAGGRLSRGEMVITARGLEGGVLYPLTPSLRQGAALTAHFLPDLAPEKLAARLAAQRPGESRANRLRKLGLSPAAQALVQEFGRALPLDQALTALPLPYASLRPMDEAISVAGGVSAASLGPDLSLRPWPGVFACGEMLDWEAPTGGYLLTGCLATGAWAGAAAARYQGPPPFVRG